ncbi:MAG TPA: alpha/beta fold hydrolase [Rhizomicrobium sp.]|nr:alpha/beta fold hydrolase [Rhizomicrobium sp.]
MRALLVAALLLTGIGAAAADEIASLAGDWDGTLPTGRGVSLRMTLRVDSSDGKTTAYMVSLDQGGVKIPIAGIARDGDSVTFDAPTVQGSYSATLSRDGKTMTGRWAQRVTLPLTLTRRAEGAPDPAARRPQDPKPPYPYVIEDIVFDGPGGIRLAGTFIRPNRDGPFPAVVLIQGSGPFDRDEAMMGHRPFWVLADALARQGIAVLRADKRGVGKSGGDPKTATSRDFAADTQAAIAYLKQVKTINPRRIGLIGHSEGGLIAPMVAAEDPSVAFIVLMAGPGLKGEDILDRQQRLIGQAMDVAPGALESALALNRKLYAAVKSSTDSAGAKAKAEAVLEAAGVPAGKRAASAAMAAMPWFRFFLDYDPVPALRQVRCPVLAINGSLDLQVPPKEDLAAIGAALAGNPDTTILELPGLNHLFQTSKTGSPAEYAQIDETIAPSVLALIGDWIRKHSK